MMLSLVLLALYFSAVSNAAINFAYEAVQLTPEFIKANQALEFQDISSARSAADDSSAPRCRYQPGDEGWPTEEEWAAFNTSLGGKLLKPVPPGAACYRGPYFNQTQCDFLVGPAKDTRFYLDDPLTALTSWTEGSTCLAVANATGNCTQGGFPVFVVNATTVRDIQMAVNFARNKNLRLNIKNTGHDFGGRSTGRGSLSVWVHHIKTMDFLPAYSMGRYTGRAAKLSAGIETWEVHNAMVQQGDTVVVTSGDTTLAMAGGWSAGGGHSILSSLYGMGSDQILSLNLVTADGRFRTADATHNEDLFFALRGGGGGTFGIVTSAIFKAYPPIGVSGLAYSFHAGTTNHGNQSVNGPFPANPAVAIRDPEIFWRAFNKYMAFTSNSSAVGGFGLGDLASLGNNSFTFRCTFILPNMTAAEAQDFMRPLFASFRSLGIDMSDPPASIIPYASSGNGTGDAPENSVFASRLLPRDNWTNRTLFNLTTEAIRHIVQDGGFKLHTRGYTPTAEAAGYPGNSSGLNPALRESMMHVTVFEPRPITADTTAADFLARHAVLNRYTDDLRRLTPGSGAYANEADIMEPDWQQSFFGANYNDLLRTKRKYDPWSLFWAPKTVGSENWEVVTADGLPSQNGPLCRTETKLTG